MSDLSVNYTYHLLFKALKSLRRKHKLTINNLLILNACYLYQKHVGTAFYVTSIYKFVTYYPIPVMQKFFAVLIEKECIYPTDYARGQLYKLTEKGIAIIDEMNGDYQATLQKFTSEYNINI